MWKLISGLKFIKEVSDLLKKIICTLLLVLASLSFSVNVSAAERYQWITSTDFVTISYDTTSIKYYSTPVKMVGVWVSWNYTEEGAKKFLEHNRAQGRYKTAKWDDFSYILEHNLISKNSLKFLESFYYDVNGNVINSTPFNENAKWNSIVPDSLGEEIRNKFRGFLDS